MPGNLWSSTSLSCLSLSPQFLHSHFRLGSRGFLFWRHSLQFPIGSYSQSHGSLFYTHTQSRFSATTKAQKNSPGRQHGMSWLSLPPSKGWMPPISCRPLPHFLGSHKIKKQSMQTCDFHGQPVYFWDGEALEINVLILFVWLPEWKDFHQGKIRKQQLLAHWEHYTFTIKRGIGCETGRKTKIQ